MQRLGRGGAPGDARGRAWSPRRELHRRLHFGGDGAEGIEGGRSACDRTADDEVVGSGAHGIAWSHDAFLVADIASCGAHAGSDDDKTVAEFFPQRADFARAGHDATEAAAEAHFGEMEDLLLGGAGNSDGAQGFVIHTGEHAHAEDEGF